MSEIKIARFVGIEACKIIFSEKSTFVLRSPEHYRRLYETSEGGNTKGDRDEGYAKTSDGGTAEYSQWITSCWTILEKSEPTCEEWDVFKKDDQNIVAIISTPSKVCEFLNKVLETGGSKGLPFDPVKHREVNYEPVHIDHTNINSVVPFVKDESFEKENEYRFVIEYGWGSHLIDSFIFCGGIDYMEKRFVNPEINEENRKSLRRIIGRVVGCGDFEGMESSDIIANADILLP